MIVFPMTHEVAPSLSSKMSRRSPWNSGRALGQKMPFAIEEARRLKDLLRGTGRHRDLVLASVVSGNVLHIAKLAGQLGTFRDGSFGGLGLATRQAIESWARSPPGGLQSRRVSSRTVVRVSGAISSSIVSEERLANCH